MNSCEFVNAVIHNKQTNKTNLGGAFAQVDQLGGHVVAQTAVRTQLGQSVCLVSSLGTGFVHCYINSVIGNQS